MAKFFSQVSDAKIAALLARIDQEEMECRDALLKWGEDDTAGWMDWMENEYEQCLKSADNPQKFVVLAFARYGMAKALAGLIG